MLNLTISKHAHLCNFLTAFSASAWLPKEMQSHRQLPLKPSGQIQPTLTRDMEASELRCSCKSGESEPRGTGRKGRAQRPEPCAAGTGLQTNAGKLRFLRQVHGLRRITPPQVYWSETPRKSHKIPEILARTSRCSATLPSFDLWLLTSVPPFLQFLFWVCTTKFGRSYRHGLEA